MKLVGVLSFLGVLLLASSPRTMASDSPLSAAPGEFQTYLLSPNDLVNLKVYQEDDLETKFRIAKDGTASLPLIGQVAIGGKTVDQASKLIHDLFNKDFLVNPQINLTVVEYAKRRFTVLGQVQKPGSFEIPNEETVTLLQAVAMAGGYTRLANPSKITVSRSGNGQKTTAIVDGRAMAKDPATQSYLIQPDDTITVAERLF
jgi:polysaccharide export outer membrane protein